MTFEERIEYHDQWLRAMESNQQQFAADLAAVNRTLDRFAEDMIQIRQALGGAIQAIASLADENRKLAQAQQRSEDGLRKLEETVDRYIRARGNGSG